MSNTELLEFLKKNREEELVNEDATIERQCPECGHIIQEESLNDLEYQVDGILKCPSCSETIED